MGARCLWSRMAREDLAQRHVQGVRRLRERVAFHGGVVEMTENLDRYGAARLVNRDTGRAAYWWPATDQGVAASQDPNPIRLHGIRELFMHLGVEGQPQRSRR